jgi:putative heme transporter
MLDQMSAVTEGPEQDVPVEERPRARWRWLRLLGYAAALVVAVLVLRGKVPRPHQVVSAVESAQPGWLLLGSVAEGVSLAMFARQQMWLLRGFGVSTTLWRALAVTYSRSAIAISMPAGSAVSAGFAYKAFRRWGASQEAAATVMILSGLLSALGLGLLYLLGFFVLLASHPESTWRAHPIGTVAAITVVAGALAYSVWSSGYARRAVCRWTEAESEIPADEPGLAGKVRGWLALARRTGIAALSMPVLYRRVALAFAVGNWLTDLCCLAAVAQAFHLPLNFYQLGTVYVVVQVVRQLPVTPGGIGLIEASLLTALVAAGASQGPAAAAVLGYRLFSAWLIIPAGLFAWALLRRKQAA